MATNNQQQISSNITIIIWGIILFVVSGLLVLIFICEYNRYSDIKNISVSVSFKNNNKFHLKLYPNWFFYDSKYDSLYLSKVINRDEKEQLLNLIPENAPFFADYKSAIDELAYKASQQQGKFSASFLLILCGIMATIGVQTRTMWNFIGRVCYKNGVDMNIWWPWYVLRPLIGFIVGIIISIIWDLDLLNLGNNKEKLNCVLFVGFLAGFAIQDVIEFLRRIAKKIFSSSEVDDPTTDLPPENQSNI
ncbi:MAG: hypothetical protein ABSC11_11330 [Smithella sp.]|jgi:hypothetical protein